MLIVENTFWTLQDFDEVHVAQARVRSWTDSCLCLTSSRCAMDEKFQNSGASTVGDCSDWSSDSSVRAPLVWSDCDGSEVGIDDVEVASVDSDDDADETTIGCPVLPPGFWASPAMQQADSWISQETGTTRRRRRGCRGGRARKGVSQEMPVSADEDTDCADSLGHA